MCLSLTIYSFLVLMEYISCGYPYNAACLVDERIEDRKLSEDYIKYYDEA